ncbi:PIR protein [Plasmodium malariae]|uniref:PIR protein n=1 Tax=Plasmodium malariae TaxID=5858 RepID=A0A1D3SMB9_PLAMA|nr:PIR protein [Plasmodium malariae]SCO92889.1 PIR protein [Plasmodium malariae]
MSLNIIIYDVGVPLPSTLNYNNLNKKKSYDSDRKCNKLADDLSEYKNVFDFCENFTGVIENFDKFSFVGQFDDDSCKVVKFWVYDRLFNLRTNNTNVSDINKIINKLNENINLDKIQKCTIFDFKYSKEVFYKMKSLYDYATNYKTIKDHLYGKNYICNKNLKDYIDKNYEIYINIKNNCNTSDRIHEEYCKVYEYIKEVFINEALPLSCKVRNIESEADEQEEFGESSREGMTQTLGSLSQGDKERSVFSGKSERGHDSVLTFEDHKPSVPITNIIVGVIFPLLGIFCIFFIFYKFTPFKSWLRTHLLKKKIIQYYEVEEYIQKNLNESYHTNGQHMRYHPL